MTCLATWFRKPRWFSGSMTLTATAWAPWVIRSSRISFWAAAVGFCGRRKMTSTLNSPSALRQPASQMVQNSSGLLLTKATLGFPDRAPPPPPPPHPRSGNTAHPTTNQRGSFMECDSQRRRETGFPREDTRKGPRSKHHVRRSFRPRARRRPGVLELTGERGILGGAAQERLHRVVVPLGEAGLLEIVAGQGRRV